METTQNNPSILGSTDTMLGTKARPRTPVRDEYWLEQKFTQIEKRWYLKLKEAGFVDIEIGSHRLEVKPQIFDETNVGEQNGSGEAHYDFCQEVLRGYSFLRKVDRAIFELHAEGMSTVEISEWLTDSVYREFTDRQVRNIIETIQQEFLRG